MVEASKDSVPPSKPSARSVFGLLFNPQLGATIKPLGESTRIFLHLLASVFASYNLIPRDFPGLRDENASMSLGGIMGTAWQGLRFNKAGLPKVGMFFAVLGAMVFGLLAAVSALLSLLIGHAHAQGEFILPGGNQDIAQAWINYLFLGQNMPNFTGPAYIGQAGTIPAQNQALQGALIEVLAFYSEAMLIIAAMILFYHLTAMIMETAHHGQVMGKRANQMWAPIRLVIAIGLLIPITTGGLNSGQYIVIKMAELGSALATNGWNLFLTALTAYNPANVPPMAPVVTQVAADLMSSEACAYDYNARITAQYGGSPAVNGVPGFGGFNNMPAGVQALLIQVNNGVPGIQCPMTINGHAGVKYSFTPGTPNGGKCSAGILGDQDICGWYFKPTANGNLDAASATAYVLEQNAFDNAVPLLTTAATTGPQGIRWLMKPELNGLANTAPILIDATDIDAVVAYQQAMGNSMARLATTMTGAMQQAVATLQPYGWVLAGALLPMVARMQAMVGNAATAGMPETHSPAIFDPDANVGSFKGKLTAVLDDVAGKASATPPRNYADPRAEVTEDMKNFMVLTSKTWAQTQSASGPNAQCAAMIGLQDAAHDGGQGKDNIVNAIFSLIDRAAQLSGVWSEGTGQPCGGGSGLTTFNVGIQQINGGDPLSEMAALGHANLNTGFLLLGISMAGSAGSGAVDAVANYANKVPALSAVGHAMAGIEGFAASVLGFISLLFMMCGFTLAYILPLFPFTRFFFSVLVWIAALLEAVVAVPLIALAHLNPEGEGLPGNSARAAYFYVFNILLRPILMIFGLVCGLLLFLIAVSFLTYAYNLAVAASGGTAYGHEMMSKFIYTIMYVAIMYVSANHSFQLIDHIPEKALSWMGAQAQSMASIGNAQHLANTEQLVGSVMQQQMNQNATGSADNLRKMLAGLGPRAAGPQPTLPPNAGKPATGTPSAGSSMPGRLGKHVP